MGGDCWVRHASVEAFQHHNDISEELAEAVGTVAGFYVFTNGETCTDVCDDLNGNWQCVGGVDDAHHQLAALNDWNEEEGLDQTNCTVSQLSSERSAADSHGKSQGGIGCDSTWITQTCFCRLQLPQ